MNNGITRTCSDERPCIPCYSDSGDCIGPAEKNHTPGPWAIHPRAVEEDGSVSPSHIANSDGYFVCAVEANAVAEIAIKQPGTFWDRSPRREANARLIAAAPELLTKLTELIGAAEYLQARVVETRGADCMDNLDVAIDEARAAIAKATGGAQ